MEGAVLVELWKQKKKQNSFNNQGQLRTYSENFTNNEKGDIPGLEKFTVCLFSD